MKIHHSELFQLKNIGAASVNIIYSIGSQAPAELCEVGAVETYRRIRENNINVSKTMLCALHGTILNIHWNDHIPRYEVATGF